MNRVGTFDAFLPCELDRRREATPSAAGPFLHVRGERASSYQSNIPFRVAATTTTAASTTTERQAHKQIAASSESEVGICVTRGSSFPCKHHRAAFQNCHEIRRQHLAAKFSKSGRSKTAARNCRGTVSVGWPGTYGLRKHRPALSFTPTRQSAARGNTQPTNPIRGLCFWPKSSTAIRGGGLSNGL
jgi:hypothetical protein